MFERDDSPTNLGELIILGMCARKPLLAPSHSKGPFYPITPHKLPPPPYHTPPTSQLACTLCSHAPPPPLVLPPLILRRSPRSQLLPITATAHSFVLTWPRSAATTRRSASLPSPSTLTSAPPAPLLTGLPIASPENPNTCRGLRPQVDPQRQHCCRKLCSSVRGWHLQGGSPH